jgi:nucleotide-binding universal stress UspA family protein
MNQDAAEKAAVALLIAEDTCSKVHLCYSLKNTNPDISRTMQTQIMKEAELRKLVPQVSYERCDVDCVVEYGDAGSHILDLAGKVSADLIIMGAKRSSSWLALSEGVVGHVLAKAQCPVMTVCTS